MATQANGILAPAGTDAYLPDADMRALVGSMHGRIHILAANTAGRTGLQSTCGWTPTAADPLVVLQTDTRELWTWDGTTWLCLNSPKRGLRASQTLALSAGTPTALTLARVSGDTDMISSGNILIPTGWGGMWAFSVNWVCGAAVGARAFIDLKNNTTGDIWRQGVLTTENYGSNAQVIPAAAGNTFTVTLFCGGAQATNTCTVDAFRVAA